MPGLAYFIAVLTVFGISGSVLGNVTQCYYCNSQYCGDTFDVALASLSSCSDILKNVNLFSSRIINSGALEGFNDSQVVTTNYTEDIETITSQNTADVAGQRSHAEIFDIKRKIWEFFNKGEIDQNTQFVCVKANYNTENGQIKTYRGCVPKYTRSISTACDFVNQKVAGASTGRVYSCYTCEYNLCNSGINLKNSFVVMVVGVVLKHII